MRLVALATRTLAWTAAAATLAALVACGPEPAREVTSLTGAGATFPYPVYSTWAHEYRALTGVGLNYQSIGSGGGIQQINNRTVDFGASDAVVKGDELSARGQIMFPMVIGGVVPVVNLQGVEDGAIVLDGETLAAVFLGEVKRWDDPAIAALNPGLGLPSKEIAVVHRADGSGTTFIFTDYLSKVSGAWKDRVGSGSAVQWPVGMGGKGNEGVASYVKQLDGAIGYVEFAYALQNKMAAARLKNREGQAVSPTEESFSAAAENADWLAADHFGVVLTDQPGAASWPITGASFIILYKDQPDAAKARALLEFFHWCYRDGGEQARKLDYVPIPEKVYAEIEALWKAEVTAGGQPVWN